MINWDDVVLDPIKQVFGEVVGYQPVIGPAFSPRVIFTDAVKAPAMNEDGSAGWTTTAPSIGVQLSDFALAPTHKDRVTRKGKTYIVTDHRPDGIGWMVLTLKAMG